MTQPIRKHLLRTGWFAYLIQNVADELNDWLYENEHDPNDWLDEYDPDERSLLDDVSETINISLNYCDSESKRLVKDLVDLAKTINRFYTCREINAWEIKPCWNVYQQIKKQLGIIETDLIDLEENKESKGNLKDIQMHIKQAVSELDVAVEDSELPGNSDSWLIDFRKKLTKLGTIKINELDIPSHELIKLHQAAVDYCKCQGYSVDEQCLQELSNIHKSINYHPQSGWYDESPQRGLYVKARLISSAPGASLLAPGS